MRIAAVVLLLLVALLLAGLPGITGLAPRLENEPWGLTTYAFAYGADVGNFGNATARNVTIRVALLRDFEPFQAVDTLVVETPGFAVETDDLGNRFALYRLPDLPPGASFVVNITGRVRIFSIDFAASSRSFSTSGPAPQFTAPEPFVESADPRILNVSRAISANSTSRGDFAYRAYEWTTQHLTYETQSQERGALWALKTGRGMCYEYSNLYASLLRAQGMAAKRVNGWGERFQVGEVLYAEEIAHAWVLVYTSDHGWLPVDPTFGDVHLYENFLKINDMHVVLTEGVNRNFYRVTYDRTTGPNVQVDYTVRVLAKGEENLSLSRQIVFVSMAAFPLVAAVTILARVLQERHRRTHPPTSERSGTVSLSPDEEAR